MKNIHSKIILMLLLIFFSRRAMAQAKLVVNGGVIIIANGASLIIDNPDNTAITYNGTGYIQSEGDANKLIWSIGAGNGNTFLIPFGNAAYNFSFQFNATSGTGANGQIILSTYPTPTWKNSDYLPPGVINVNKNGTDNSAKIIDRFWQINAQGYTTKPTLSNVIFSYTDLEYSAPNSIIKAGLVPQRWNSTLLTWDDYFPLSSVNTTTNKVTLSTLPANQLYNWWTLVDASTALPVTLVNFKAHVQNKVVVTNWQTTAENNGSYFEVWRSRDANQFEALTQLAAAGNSTGVLNYSFTDDSPYLGTSYYRLKSVDLNGKFTWSVIVQVVNNNTSFVTVSPNPASGHINLSVSAEIAGSKPMAFIYDGKGSLVKSFRIATTYQLINIALLPAGIYHIQFIYTQKLQTISFIKK